MEPGRSGTPSSQDEIHAQLAQAKANKQRTTYIIAGVAAVIIALLAYLFFFRSSDSEPAATDGATSGGELVKLKIADTAQSDFQDAIVDVGKENGLDIEFINFSDPYLPNTALVEGEVDANAFQHVAWLSQFNMQYDEDVTPLFSTVISTWGLFSATHETAEDIPENARIAVPDDPANFSRAMFILQSAGLLEVDPSAGVFPTEDDIVANPKNLELVRLAHESTQTAYDDPQIDGVILGADDLDPALGVTSEDAVLLEDSSAESSAPYIIVVATTPDRVDDPVWAQLEKTYRDDRVVSALEEEKRGEATVVEFPIEQLRSTLAELTTT